MSLPVLTTSDDVRGIIDYLKTKPTGATVTEAKGIIDTSLLDGRKISAYSTWGLVSRDGDRIKLTQCGWDMARKSKSEVATYIEILDSILPYRSALEWIFHRKFEEVTNVDIAAQWHEHHSEFLGTENENTIKDQAVCFMRLVDAAGFGSFVIGRRGQTTRLIVGKDPLKIHIESGPDSPPWTERATPAMQELTTLEDSNTTTAVSESRATESIETGFTKEPISKLKVFISHGKTPELLEQVQTLLALADIEFEIAVKEESTAIPVPEKVLTAMRNCLAAIIIVAVEEAKKNHDGNYAINENVLIEIGAAFVLYDRKVVLVWDKRLPVPSNLQGLYRCEFEGDELNWGAGLKLMKAIKEFRK